MPSLSEIQALADKIAREFHPDKIILFGSHALKKPTPDSDVDLLVIMPLNGKSPHHQAAEIYLKCRSLFPVDILVRTRGNSSTSSECVTGLCARSLAKE